MLKASTPNPKAGGCAGLGARRGHRPKNTVYSASYNVPKTQFMLFTENVVHVVYGVQKQVLLYVVY